MYLLYVIVVLIILSLYGRALSYLLSRFEIHLRQLWAPFLGVIFMVLQISNMVFIFRLTVQSATIASFIITSILAFISFKYRKKPKENFSDKTEIWKLGLVITGVFVTVCGGYFFVNIESFSGAFNGDSFNHVSVAEWIKTNSYYEQVDLDKHLDLSAVERYKLHNSRMGPQFIIAAISSLTNLPTKSTYGILNGVVAVLIALTMYLTCKDLMKMSINRSLVAAILYVTNSYVLFAFFWGNFPHFLGVMLFALLFIVLLTNLVDYWILWALVGASVISIYPEIFPFLIIIGFIYSLVSQRLSFSNVKLMFKGLFLMPLLDIVGFYHFIINIQRQAAGKSGLGFMEISPLNFLAQMAGVVSTYPEVILTKFSFLGNYDEYFISILGIAFLALIVSSYIKCKNTDLRKVCVSAITVYFFAYIVFVLKQYPYGQFKVVYYSLPFVFIMLANTHFSKKYFAIFLILISLALNISNTYYRYGFQIFKLDTNRYNFIVKGDIIGLQNFAKNNSNKSVLIMEKNTVVQYWLSYYARAFDQVNVMNPGPYMINTKLSNNQDYLLVNKTLVDSGNIINKNLKSYWSSSSHILTDNKNVMNISEDGWGALENINNKTFRWLGKSGKVSISAPDRELLLKITAQAPPWLQNRTLEIRDSHGDLIQSLKFSNSIESKSIELNTENKNIYDLELQIK